MARLARNGEIGLKSEMRAVIDDVGTASIRRIFNFVNQTDEELILKRTVRYNEDTTDLKFLSLKDEYGNDIDVSLEKDVSPPRTKFRFILEKALKSREAYSVTLEYQYYSLAERIGDRWMVSQEYYSKKLETTYFVNYELPTLIPFFKIWSTMYVEGRGDGQDIKVSGWWRRKRVSHEFSLDPTTRNLVKIRFIYGSETHEKITAILSGLTGAVVGQLIRIALELLSKPGA